MCQMKHPPDIDVDIDMVNRGKVINRSTLKGLALAIMSVVGTVLPIMVALAPRTSLGAPPVWIADDVFQLPSGQLIAVSNTHRDYNASVAYCASRGMTIGSIHSQADSNSLEHVVTEPTYLGAIETGGATSWGVSGVWSWEDGSEWDYQSAAMYNFNHDFRDQRYSGYVRRRSCFPKFLCLS